MLPSEYTGAVNFFWVKIDSLRVLDSVRSAIDRRFANSPDATITQPEELFIAQFTKMFGDIPKIVETVGIIVVFSIMLVVGNSMSMSIRERVRELAVLRAVGYRPRRIFVTVLAESVLLSFVGGLIGCLPPFLAFGRSEVAALHMPYFPTVSVTPATVVVGLGAAVLIGLSAGIASARQVAKLPVACALRSVE